MSRGCVGGSTRALRLSRPPRPAQASGPDQRASADALALRLRPADRLLIAPQDLRTADPTRASEIYAGRFAFAGKVVICDGRSPFEIDAAVRRMGGQLLGFGWLRHLRAAESAITRANARALVDEWIALQGAFASARLAARHVCRGGSCPGSARRRSCCTTPTCGSIAASCAT